MVHCGQTDNQSCTEQNVPQSFASTANFANGFFSRRRQTDDLRELLLPVTQLVLRISLAVKSLRTFWFCRVRDGTFQWLNYIRSTTSYVVRVPFPNVYLTRLKDSVDFFEMEKVSERMNEPETERKHHCTSKRNGKLFAIEADICCCVLLRFSVDFF